MRTSGRKLWVIGVWLLIGCGTFAARQPAEGTPKGKTATAPAAGMDACALLTKEDVQSVQGERVIEAKPSRQQHNAFLMTQCFYSVNPSADSVAVALAMPDPANPARSGPKEFWSRNFHSSQKEAGGNSHAGDEEKEGKASSIEAVDLGDEAYWVRNRFGGSLYVLKGDAFFIISLGGKQAEAARINKAKALAKGALKRMG